MELSTYLEITVGFLCNQNCFVKIICAAQIADISCLQLDFFKYTRGDIFLERDPYYFLAYNKNL